MHGFLSFWPANTVFLLLKVSWHSPDTANLRIYSRKCSPRRCSSAGSLCSLCCSYRRPGIWSHPAEARLARDVSREARGTAAGPPEARRTEHPWNKNICCKCQFWISVYCPWLDCSSNCNCSCSPIRKKRRPQNEPGKHLLADWDPRHMRLGLNIYNKYLLYGKVLSIHYKLGLDRDGIFQSWN